MIHHISKFQPVGDAASELRAIVPGLVQSQAVNILRNAEDGSPWNSDSGVIVADNDTEWEVWTES